jgi:Uma2 family endonuclease
MTAKPPTRPERPFRFTCEQYYKLGELGFFDGKRVELIRGEIIEMSPINIAHATGVGLVVDALTIIFAAGFYVNSQQPFSVPSVAPGSEPQPDISVIPGPRRRNAHPTQAALLVEVADSTFFYDTTTKAELYATANVPEYWVLDLNNRELHVFRDPQPLPLPTELSATAYQIHDTLGPNDTVSPLAAPNAVIHIADLLP